MDEVKDYPSYLDYPKPYKVQTNADRIRSMEDEELAKILNAAYFEEWISVDDRLPDKPMKCLVYTKRGDCGGYEITYYNQGFYLQYSNVTHWMPLPHPPKGE